eukprot:scaffold3882_cov164-Amphora_coffeaeformis.AAC.15
MPANNNNNNSKTLACLLGCARLFRAASGMGTTTARSVFVPTDLTVIRRLDQSCLPNGQICATRRTFGSRK